jgi:hypothetical protein
MNNKFFEVKIGDTEHLFNVANITYVANNYGVGVIYLADGKNVNTGVSYDVLKGLIEAAAG